MEYATIAGNYYLVTSKNGGTVTDATGTLNKPIDAGDQLTVGAPSDKLICDDEEAVIRRANFKHALAALSLLGGGKSELPMGFQRAEYLESTGGYNSYILTGVQASGMNAKAVASYHGTGPQPSSVFHVLSAETSTSRYHIGFNTIQSIAYGLRTNGEPIHWSMLNCSYGSVCTLSCDFQTLAVTMTSDLGIRKVSIPEKYRTITPNCYFCLFVAGSTEPERVSSVSYNKEGMRIYLAEIDRAGVPVANFIPALAPTGAPCMFDTVSRKPFYNGGTGEFIVGLTLRQARNFWHKLPTTGGALTVSLPVGYEADAGVAASLARAAERGWVLTIQTYTPEGEAAAASTFAFRRVWVRRRADENGTYVAADGSRWQVEWCVDVVGSSPEAEGYEPFRSQEAAVAYWELVPWVDPEAEQEENFLTDQTNGQD